MSPLAEFARELHENNRTWCERRLTPVHCPSRTQALAGIKAVIVDVYGTLINYWRPGLDDNEQRLRLFSDACRKTADFFGFTEFLEAMDPDGDPGKTLYDLYCGCIALSHEAALKKGAVFPEVKIEKIWDIILQMLKRRGYVPEKVRAWPERDLARYMAYFYNFHALGRELYPGVTAALAALQEKGMLLGIVSNAQFYTPLDLTLAIRDQSNGAFDDLHELFDPDLTFFSYEYAVAKPGQLLFGRLFDALRAESIEPPQSVLIGNDLAVDIEPAGRGHMKTAFFSGDDRVAFFHDKKTSIVPDLAFQSWSGLPGMLSLSPQEAVRS